MKIQVEKNNDIAIVAMDGEINYDNSVQLRNAFLKITKEGINKVIVDFEKVTFIDSAGLATLIEMLQGLRKTKGKLLLCNVNKHTRGIFEITKIHKLITIYDNRDMAIEGL